MIPERAATVAGLLRELKVQLVDESQAAGGGEHDAIQDVFVRLARVDARLTAAQDAAAVTRIEAEQARSVAMDQRTLLHRRHLNVVCPPFVAPSSRDPNLVFYSGPADGRDALRRHAESRLLALNGATHGADFAATRWRELRAAGTAIFDVSELAAQVMYDLGVAMTFGTHTIVLAEASTRIPFDIGQEVVFYEPGHVADGMAAVLDQALYGATAATDPRSSVDSAVAHARALATAHGTDLATAIFNDLPHTTADPIRAHDLLALLDTFVPDRHVVVLRSRWAASFPQNERRTFVVMPFRPDLDPTWSVIQMTASATGVRAIRGDEAAGQEIISSIWTELGRATDVVVDLTRLNPNVCLELGIADTLGRPALLIGKTGTEHELEHHIPSLAKRRCHTYTRADDITPILDRFFSGELSWA